jgi:ubiquinone/menaquinone biosynthesis C-methylase UbiE
MIHDPKNIINFYDRFNEDERMQKKSLEYIRCKEIISRYLPKERIAILDIGGATGSFSFWLAEQGYDVSLIDIVPKHIEIAKSKEKEKSIKLESIIVGDARSLPYEDDSFEIVLLMGPLYHLIDQNERQKSLKEAYRVLKQNGIIITETISRYASLFDGFLYGLVNDPEFVEIMNRDIKTGFHRDTSESKIYFTDSYFHRPEEIIQELTDVGFKFEELISVTGFGNVISNIEEKIKDKKYLNVLLDTLRITEKDPMLFGVSSHFMGIGKKLLLKKNKLQ